MTSASTASEVVKFLENSPVVAVPASTPQASTEYSVLGSRLSISPLTGPEPLLYCPSGRETQRSMICRSSIPSSSLALVITKRYGSLLVVEMLIVAEVEVMPLTEMSSTLSEGLTAPVVTFVLEGSEFTSTFSFTATTAIV